MNISKYLRSISPELKSWINSLAMKSKDPTVEAKRIVTQGGEKLKKIDMFSPESFRIFDKQDLDSVARSAQSGGGSQFSDFYSVGLIDPDNYRLLAARLTDDKLPDDYQFDPISRDMMSQTNENVASIKDKISEGIPLGGPDYTSGVPQLGYKLLKGVDGKPIIQINMHEGRHRMRALKDLGSDEALVQLFGDADIKNLPPDTPIYDELSTMQQDGGRYVGKLGDILKILGFGGVAVKGALSNLPDDST
tara:strand:- start:2839 stop:3585 length:747 start_codon:yes stop_codon:yes gene_type:complete